MVEPVTGLAIFAGSWLAKKLAKDWADKKKSHHSTSYQAAVFEHGGALEKCTEHQEKARGSLGRIGIQRIEAMRRILPQATVAAGVAHKKKLAPMPFGKEGWFDGRSQKTLFGLASSMIAVDLVLPEDSPVTAAETILSTLAAQGAYTAFETMPHHDGADASSMMLSPEAFNSTVNAGVSVVENQVGRVDDFFSNQDAAKDAAEFAQSLDVESINSISSQADSLLSTASGAIGDGVNGVVAEVGGAMNVLGDFVGDFVGPAGWALAGFTFTGTLRESKKLVEQRGEIRVQTGELNERTERAKRIFARGEEIEDINSRASYNAFKHSWIMRQVTQKRFRSKSGRERDLKRAVLLEKSTRNFWQAMHAPLLGEGGDAAKTPLPAV
jgi:hypothetical protein